MHPISQVLIWVAYGMIFLPCISHTRWAVKCSESRAIAQAQEEEHGGYVAMTLTFKMATTSKWTNLTQKVANVVECNHQQNIGQKQHHQNTQVKLPTCSLYNPWHYDLSAHTVCVWSVSTFGCNGCVCCKWLWLLVFNPPVWPGVGCGGRQVDCGGWGVVPSVSARNA